MATGWTDADIPDLGGQRFLVTGGNTGLGFETARALSKKGAEVVILCRDRTRGEEALRRLGSSRGALELLDLGALASIRAFAERELAGSGKITGLVCNAGLMAIPEQKTADGFERQMGVNHLGHFALVGLLLPKLSSARIVSVTSDLHKRGRLDLFDDLFFEKNPYDRWTAYNQSKLANLLFMFELARRADKHGLALIPVAAHPGYSATELQSRGMQEGSPKWEGWGMAIGNRLFAQPSHAGAWPQLRAATDPSARPGDYFGPSGFMELRGPAVRVEPRRAVRDETVARELWVRSEELTGVRYLD
jgi:NAD(P)-dependent dehydrogenase (short-subunit alcohol dehydrogenase family)